MQLQDSVITSASIESADLGPGRRPMLTVGLSVQICVAEDEEARVLVPVGPTHESQSSSIEQCDAVRQVASDAGAKAAPPAPSTPQVSPFPVA